MRVQSVGPLAGTGRPVEWGDSVEPLDENYAQILALDI
jgi:hypothetical protein